MAKLNIGTVPLYFEDKTQKLDPERDMIDVDLTLIKYIDEVAPKMKEYFLKDPFKFLIIMKILSCTDQLKQIKIFEELNNGTEFNVLVRKILIEIPRHRVDLILEMIANRLIGEWNYFNNLWFIDDQQTYYNFPFYFNIEFYERIKLFTNDIMKNKDISISSLLLLYNEKDLECYLGQFK